MSAIRTASFSTVSEINITPLLDLAFVLLIIFMIRRRSSKTALTSLFLRVARRMRRLKPDSPDDFNRPARDDQNRTQNRGRGRAGDAFDGIEATNLRSIVIRPIATCRSKVISLMARAARPDHHQSASPRRTEAKTVMHETRASGETLRWSPSLMLVVLLALGAGVARQCRQHLQTVVWMNSEASAAAEPRSTPAPTSG